MFSPPTPSAGPAARLSIHEGGRGLSTSERSRDRRPRSQRRKALVLAKAVSVPELPDLRAYLRALANVPACCGPVPRRHRLPPMSCPSCSTPRFYRNFGPAGVAPPHAAVSTNRVPELRPAGSLRKASTVQELRGDPRGGLPTMVGVSVSGQAESRVTRALRTRSAGRTSSLTFAPESHTVEGYPGT